jgi:hypothetical protein
MTRRRAAVLVVLASLLAPPAAGAATYRVTTTADVACDPPGACGLRGAIVLSNRSPERDAIVVPAGVYTLTQGALNVAGDVTIQGEGARQTFIDANGAATQQRGFVVSPGSVLIERMTIRDGVAPEGLTQPPYGGNVLNRGGTLILRHTHLTGGSASSGGAVANWFGGVLTLDRSLVARNNATTGGGDGGGVANIGFLDPDTGSLFGEVTIRNTTITDNHAQLGGAVSQWSGAGNQMVIQNATIARNVARNRGGGFLGDDPQEADGTVTIRGSLVAGNLESSAGTVRRANCDVVPTDAGGNLEDLTDCGFKRPDDRQGADPALGNLRDLGGETDVLELGTLSPARDISPRACVTQVDQRDVARPQGVTCDAGAHELTVTYTVAVAPAAGSTRVGVAQDVTVTVRELGRPLAGAAVAFTVDDGPSRGATHTATTDAMGEATWRFAGAAPGTDSVRATYTDPQGGTHAASAQRSWTAPDGAIALTPPPAPGPVGTPQTLTATVTEDGLPVLLRPVTFTVVAGPNAGGTATPSTGGDGRASFSYTGAAAGTDTVRASFQNAFGTAFAADATVVWNPTGLGPDRDEDGILDTPDNCIDDPNPGQADGDEDGVGDACDPLPPGDAPVVTGEIARVRELSGTVFVRLPRGPGARAAQAESGFVPLKGVATVPVGSVVDARKGRMALSTTAGPGRRGSPRLQTGRFAAAMFMIRQARRATRIRRARTREQRALGRWPATDLVLRTPARAARACARTSAPRGLSPVKGVVRLLSGSGKGLFRTVAGASTTITTGGIWIVQDRCRATVTQVGRGRASVFDASLRRTFVVRAGQSYRARARMFGARVPRRSR